MATDFGTLSFATSFKPSSAFPLNANEYFESYTDAEAAAATAEEAGSSNTTYYYGQVLAVYNSTDSSETGLYQIQNDGTLKQFSTTDLLSDNVSDLETVILEIKTIVESTQAEVTEINENLGDMSDILELRLRGSILDARLQGIAL